MGFTNTNSQSNKILIAVGILLLAVLISGCVQEGKKSLYNPTIEVSKGKIIDASSVPVECTARAIKMDKAQLLSFLQKNGVNANLYPNHMERGIEFSIPQIPEAFFERDYRKQNDTSITFQVYRNKDAENFRYYWAEFLPLGSAKFEMVVTEYTRMDCIEGCPQSEKDTATLKNLQCVVKKPEIKTAEEAVDLVEEKFGFRGTAEKKGSSWLVSVPRPDYNYAFEYVFEITKDGQINLNEFVELHFKEAKWQCKSADIEQLLSKINPTEAHAEELELGQIVNLSTRIGPNTFSSDSSTFVIPSKNIAFTLQISGANTVTILNPNCEVSTVSYRSPPVSYKSLHNNVSINLSSDLAIYYNKELKSDLVGDFPLHWITVKEK